VFDWRYYDLFDSAQQPLQESKDGMMWNPDAHESMLQFGKVRQAGHCSQCSPAMATKARGSGVVDARLMQQLGGLDKSMVRSKEESDTHPLDEQPQLAALAFTTGTKVLQRASDGHLVSTARTQAVLNNSFAHHVRQLVSVLPDQTMEQLLQRRVQAACHLQALGEHASGL
jgi:hypothetical protein